MSKETKVAFHGSRADPDTLKRLGGILPRVGWQNPELARMITELPDKAQNLIWSNVGPKLRGTPGQQGGQGDADPNLSVSMTWSPRVACFFPPEGIDIYMYAVDVDGLGCKDVDRFGLLCGVDRQYMKEIAVSNVQWPRILGYCTVRRWDPPGQIEKVAGHRFTKVLVGGFKLLESSLAQATTVYQEIWDAVPQGEEFGITDNPRGIVGTFHTDDSIGTAKKKPVRKLSFS